MSMLENDIQSISQINYEAKKKKKKLQYMKNM